MLGLGALLACVWELGSIQLPKIDSPIDNVSSPKLHALHRCEILLGSKKKKKKKKSPADHV